MGATTGNDHAPRHDDAVGGGSESPPGAGDVGHLLATPGRRRAFATALTAVMLLAAAWNLAPPGLRAPYRDIARPAFRESRLEQYWTYFAPEVALVSTTAFVEIERVDGSFERRDLVPEAVLLRSFRTYRWLKFAEVVNADDESWQGVLDYVLAHAASPETIVRLTLFGAETEPTVGSSGPYEPDYQVTELLSMAGPAT